MHSRLFIIQSFKACNLKSIPFNLTIPNNSNHNKLPTTTAANATRRAPSVCASSSSAPHFFGGAFCCSNIALSLCCCLFQRLCFTFRLLLFLLNKKRRKESEHKHRSPQLLLPPHCCHCAKNPNGLASESSEQIFRPVSCRGFCCKIPAVDLENNENRLQLQQKALKHVLIHALLLSSTTGIPADEHILFLRTKTNDFLGEKTSFFMVSSSKCNLP